MLIPTIKAPISNIVQFIKDIQRAPGNYFAVTI